MKRYARFVRRQIVRILSQISIAASRLKQPAGIPRLVMMPSESRKGSSMLWGWEVGHELRALGWRVTIVPPGLGLCAATVASERPDVIVMVNCRSEETKPTLYPDVPCVFILDDADYVLEKRLESVVETCRLSHFIIAGNTEVAEWCRKYNQNVTVIWTSHPIPKQRSEFAQKARAPIVAWAHGAPLHYPHEAEFIQQVVIELSKRVSFEFWLYGTSSHKRAKIKEYVEPLKRAGVNVRTIPYQRRYAAYMASLEKVAVGLHPVCLENPFSHGKSFGKTLSYMSAEVAVVTSAVLDHVQFFENEVNAMLVNNDVNEWVNAIAKLIEHPDIRQQLVEHAREDFAAKLSTTGAARQLDEILRTVIAQPHASTGGAD